MSDTGEKTGYAITEIYFLNNGGVLRRNTYTQTAKPPTVGQMMFSYQRPLAQALAGEPERGLSNIPEYHQARAGEYHFPSDGGWILEWKLDPRTVEGNWFLRQSDGAAAPINMGSDEAEALENAAAHITAQRVDQMADEHWHTVEEPRDHPGFLTLHTDKGHVVLPVTSIAYVQIEVTDTATGNPVELVPGWPKDDDETGIDPEPVNPADLHSVAVASGGGFQSTDADLEVAE